MVREPITRAKKYTIRFFAAFGLHFSLNFHRTIVFYDESTPLVPGLGCQVFLRRIGIWMREAESDQIFGERGLLFYLFISFLIVLIVRITNYKYCHSTQPLGSKSIRTLGQVANDKI